MRKYVEYGPASSKIVRGWFLCKGEASVKILAVSDQVVESVYSSRIRDRFGDVELVLSCGDLPYSYLEYIAAMLNVPCLFVHGNHDQPEYLSSGATLTHPGGWINLDGRTINIKGLLLGGLEGAMGHKPGARFQYSDSEMAFKVWRMAPTLLVNRILYGRCLDILITHSPPFGIHDGNDLAHRGFKALLKFVERFRPRYLLHGHKHRHCDEPWETSCQDTKVINVYPLRVIEW
jgi:hypothetical protein